MEIDMAVIWEIFEDEEEELAEQAAYRDQQFEPQWMLPTIGDSGATPYTEGYELERYQWITGAPLCAATKGDIHWILNLIYRSVKDWGFELGYLGFVKTKNN